MMVGKYTNNYNLELELWVLVTQWTLPSWDAHLVNGSGDPEGRPLTPVKCTTQVSQISKYIGFSLMRATNDSSVT